MRRLANPYGETIVARLEAFDEVARSENYSIVQDQIPVTGRLSTMRAQAADGGNGSRVEWSGQFTPKR